MRWFKRISWLLVLLAVAGVTLVFCLENQGMVGLSLGGWKTPEWPLALFLVLAFTLGGAIGVGLGQLLAMQYRMRVVALRKELARIRSVAQPLP